MKILTKIIVVAMLLLTISGCNKKDISTYKLIEVQANSSVNRASDYLLSKEIKRVYVKVKDDLSLESSRVKKGKDGNVEDFYSLRKVEVLDSLGEDLSDLGEIAINEGVLDGNRFKYEGMRELKKDNKYVVALIKSDEIDGYIVPIMESAVLDLNAHKASKDKDVNLADFVIRLTLDERFDDKDILEIANADVVNGMLDVVNAVDCQTKDQYPKFEFTLYGENGKYYGIRIGDYDYTFKNKIEVEI